MKSSPIDGLPLVCRPRRFRIADAMAVVGLTAMGMALVTTVIRSEEPSVFGVVAVLAVVSLSCLWPLSGLRADDRHSWPSALVGLAAVSLAIVTAVCMGILAVALAEGATVLVFMLLTLVVYMTSWD